MVFKSSAIRVRNSQLLLSTGEKNRPLTLPWRFEVPLSVEIDWKDDGHELRANYQDTRAVLAPLGDGVAGLDIGELRLAAVYDGERVDLHSGRLIRAQNHYGNKHQARLDTLIARKKRAKPGQASCKRLRRVQTIAVGNLSNIRMKMNHGSKGTQQRHGWVFSKFLLELRAQGRVFTSPCGQYRMDRGGVGAVNIRAKYLRASVASGAVLPKKETRAGSDSAYGLKPALPWTPVLEGMAPSWSERTPSRRLAASIRGVRFRVSHAALRRGEVPETSRILSL